MVKQLFPELSVCEREFIMLKNIPDPVDLCPQSETLVKKKKSEKFREQQQQQRKLQNWRTLVYFLENSPIIISR